MQHHLHHGELIEVCVQQTGDDHVKRGLLIGLSEVYVKQVNLKAQRYQDKRGDQAHFTPESRLLIRSTPCLPWPLGSDFARQSKMYSPVT